MLVQNWVDILNRSLQELWIVVANYVPNLLGALVVLVLGLIVSSGLGSLVERVIATLKVDDLLKKVGVEEYVERGGLKLNSARLLGRFVYWFIFITFLL